jgi:hypothetical protein
MLLVHISNSQLGVSFYHIHSQQIEKKKIYYYFVLGDELKRTVSIVVDLASALDPDGVDIYFLNREPMRNVRSSEELIPMFAVPPEGIYDTYLV